MSNPEEENAGELGVPADIIYRCEGVDLSGGVQVPEIDPNAHDITIKMYVKKGVRPLSKIWCEIHRRVATFVQMTNLSK